VRTFHEALLAAQSLLNDGLVEKTWVIGGTLVYQVNNKIIFKKLKLF